MALIQALGLLSVSGTKMYVHIIYVNKIKCKSNQNNLLLAHLNLWVSGEFIIWVGSLVVCLSTLNDIFSGIARRIKAKFQAETPWTGGGGGGGEDESLFVGPRSQNGRHAHIW